ncbi:MAG TPA: DNA-3-methyladenine glycosylase [Tepidisphaeraceae bacterium]|nr:DNA-3-methyladenine glycosylase [Tepidisphaeraceae bacterium]
MPKTRNRLKKLGLPFYARPATDLAQDLLGKILVHRTNGQEYQVRIVETEAYLGPADLACHASKGRTRRTEVLFGPPGHAYVYFIYGMYEMLNVVGGADGAANAVLIRAAEPLNGWQADLSGPGKLTRAIHIARSENGMDLTGDTLYMLDNPSDRPRIISSKRIGIDYAKEWKDALLRFCDADSSAVSRPRR